MTTRRSTPRLAVSRRDATRGQVVAIFAGAMLLFVLLAAVVIDLSWYWTNNLRMQRAADAAALAGVVFLPAREDLARGAAFAEAEKNGFENGVNGIAVTAVKDPANDRRLKVNIRGPVNTYFARVIGIASWPASRDAKADYILPVPMGSPDNYYGVGYLVEPVTTTTTDTSTERIYTSSCANVTWATSGCAGDAPGNAESSSSSRWTSSSSSSMPGVVGSENNQYARTSTNGNQHRWWEFGLLSEIPSPAGNQSLSDFAIQVRLTDAFIDSACSSATIGVALSWNGGGTWTSNVTVPASGALGTSTSGGDYVVGSSTSSSAWGSHTWTRSEFSDSNFRVRLTASESCSGSRQFNVDMLEVRVIHDRTTTTTTTVTTLEEATVPPPPGQAAITRPQQFWGGMQSQGAPSVQGDAYMTKYERRTSAANSASGTDPDAEYAWQDYYNYVAEFPAGTTNGRIWVYDAAFCDGSSEAGTGEYWTVGGSNGSGTRVGVSSYFRVYRDETLANLTDDEANQVGALSYNRSLVEDHEIFDALDRDTNVGDCSSQSWHLGWTPIATGLGAGTYRIHTYSTNAGAPSDQDNATGLNAFAFYASGNGATAPRIYGLGAMEAYARLPGGKATEFYLAQIDEVHAGKTMIINLWDPGDTGNLSADLQVLEPTDSGYVPARFTYRGTLGTTHGDASTDCGTRTGTSTTVRTNSGGSSRFNGCWLTLEIPLDTDYDAPLDSASGERGWWKIKYDMGGDSDDFSTDLTTWQVSIRGNPVHLVLP